MAKNNYLKKIFFMLVMTLFILYLNSIVIGEESIKYFDYENYSFSIEPILTNECNITQTTIFHIKRLNYNSNMTPIILNYIQGLKFYSINENFGYNNSNLIFEENNISKEIKSYTKSNTGSVNFKENSNYTIYFEMKNELNQTNMFEWIYEINSCENFYYNESFNDSYYNNTENDYDNETNNNEEDQDNENPFDNEDDVNINESEECEVIYEFNINTNKKIYANNEQVKIYFNNIFCENYNVTYWIEDLFGKIVKKEYTSLNSNPKSYTPNIIGEEKSFIIKAILNSNELNSTKESEHLFSVYNQNYNDQGLEDGENNYEEDENDEQKNRLIINSIEYNNEKQNILLDFIIEKNVGTKRVFKIKVLDENDKIISNEARIEIFKNGKIRLNSILNIDKTKIKEEFVAKIMFEGLDIFESNLITLNKKSNEEENKKTIIINETYTKKTFADDNFIWYVKVKGEGYGHIIINTSMNEFYVENIFVDKEKTYSFNLNYEPNLIINTILLSENHTENKIDEINLIEKNTQSKIEKDLELVNYDLNETNYFLKELKGEESINNIITGNIVDKKDYLDDFYTNKYFFTIFLIICLIIFVTYKSYKEFSKNNLQKIEKNEKMFNFKDFLTKMKKIVLK